MCASLAGLLLTAAAVLRSGAEVCDTQECGQAEEMAALQLHAVGADAWVKTSRDLATLPPPQELTLKGGGKVFLWGAVPSQGAEGFFMALLFRSGDGPLEALQQAQVHCSGPEGSHRVPARMFGAEKKKDVGEQYILVLQCPWPQQEANKGVYDIHLSEAGGHEVGQVQASYKPGLLKQYGTIACINNIWNGQVASLKLIPPWMEFQLLHGVDHFLVYTMNGTDATLLDAYEPYIAAGLATRVHFSTDPMWSRGYTTQLWMANDCLYRAKGHTRWLMPTVDADEYIRFRPGLFTGDYLRTAWDQLANNSNGKDSTPEVSSIVFQRVNFERASDDPDLEISTVYRYPFYKNCWTKIVVKVSLVAALWTHRATSVANGSVEYQVDVSDGFINHYRNKSSGPHVMMPQAGTKPDVLDDALLADIPAVSMALEKRFGGRWKAVAEKLKKGSSISIVHLAGSE